MRALITGINGFVGPWVARCLLDNLADLQLWGQAWGLEDRQSLGEVGSMLRLVEADVTDPVSVQRVIHESRPDLVIHLAAISSVAQSWSDPAATLRVNAIGQLNLLEALRHADLCPKMVVVSSAEVYGQPSSSAPLREDHPLRPLSPYGVSKASQELIAAQYHGAFGLPVFCLRLFNLIGPGQRDCFVASSLARQIAEIEAGVREPCVQVGNLEATRDFTDVRDAARGFFLVAEKAVPGEVYNLCSGVCVRIEELLQQLLSLSSASPRIEVDQSKVRAADSSVLVGDPARLNARTGWQPELSLRATLQDLLDWWRQRCTRDVDDQDHG